MGWEVIGDLLGPDYYSRFPTGISFPSLWAVYKLFNPSKRRSAVATFTKSLDSMFIFPDKLGPEC